MSEYGRSCAARSGKTRGYMRKLRASRSVAGRPSSAAAFSRAASRSAGGRFLPGRSVIAGRPLRTRSCKLRREPARGLAEPALEQLDDALGEGQLALGVERVGGRQVVGDEEQGHVADDLRGGRDLDDVAEQEVHVGVRLADLDPPRGQAQRLGLLEQVRVLAAGHLVGVDLGRRRPQAASRTGRRGRGPRPSTGSSRSGRPGRARSRAG